MNKQQIAAKLEENHRRFADFISNLSESEFLFAPEGKWNAGMQLDHIVRSVAPVRLALTLPQFIPALVFGKAKSKSEEYDSLVKKYQGRLTAGGKASGRFVPSPVSSDKKSALIEKLMKTVAGLNQRIGRFSESDLDRILLPHPILGKLTVREMLYFTIYHVEHHQEKARDNLGKT